MGSGRMTKWKREERTNVVEENSLREREMGRGRDGQEEGGKQ